MKPLLFYILIALSLTVALSYSSLASAADKTIGDFLAKPSLNVVITVSDMDAAVKFYGEVLGLEAMSPIPFPDTTAEVFFPKAVVMQRFKVGTQEIKLIPGLNSTEKYEGGIQNGIGLRMVNYPITDVDALNKRLTAHGYEIPVINEFPGSTYRFGMLTDPDGNQVEFHYYDGDAPEGWEESIQIALTVSDVEATRNFYGNVLGMKERPSVPMPGGNRKVYLFEQGPTVIKFWSFGGDLPNRAGRHSEQYGYRYIQYATKNIRTTFDFVKGRGAEVNLPPTDVFKGSPLQITFIADPDGIINEMFGIPRK